MYVTKLFSMLTAKIILHLLFLTISEGIFLLLNNIIIHATRPAILIHSQLVKLLDVLSMEIILDNSYKKIIDIICS